MQALRHLLRRAVALFGTHLWLFDTVFVAGPLLLVCFVFVFAVATSSLYPMPLFWAAATACLSAVIMVSGLTVRRTRPGLMLILVTFGGLAHIGFGVPFSPAYLAAPIAVHAAAQRGTPRQRRAAIILGLSASALLGLWILAIIGFTSTSEPPLTAIRASLPSTMTAVGFAAMTVLTAWLTGLQSGRRQREREAAVERAQLLERTRHSEAQLAAEAERLRIARELHDVVAHSMSVMIAQADGGRFAAGGADDSARVFATIAQTGREALTQMRHILGVLRSPEDSAHKRPLPTVARLDELIGSYRAAGLAVEYRPPEAGMPELEALTGLGVYRIVQEALTNCLKHAGADAHVCVDIDCTDSELTVRVTDSGGQAPVRANSPGHGLRGMRERAAVLGARLETGPTAEGYAVTLVVPLNHSGM